MCGRRRRLSTPGAAESAVQVDARPLFMNLNRAKREERLPTEAATSSEKAFLDRLQDIPVEVLPNRYIQQCRKE